MAIAINSRLDRGMPDLTLNEFDRGLPLIDEQRNKGVPEVMEAHSAELGPGQGRQKMIVDHGVVMQRLPLVPAENQSMGTHRGNLFVGQESFLEFG